MGTCNSGAKVGVGAYMETALIRDNTVIAPSSVSLWIIYEGFN